MGGCTSIWLSVHGGVVRGENMIMSRHFVACVTSCNVWQVGGEDTSSHARFMFLFCLRACAALLSRKMKKVRGVVLCEGVKRSDSQPGLAQ